MNTHSPTFPAEFASAAACVLHELLHSDDGRAFLASRLQPTHGDYLAHTEDIYRQYRQWISQVLAAAEQRFGVA